MAEAAGQHTSERLKTLAVSVPSHSAVPAKIYEIITGTPRRMAESAANFASGALSKFPALVSTPTRNAQIKHAIDKLAERQEEIRAMAQRRIRVYLTAAAGLLLGVAAIALLFLVSAWRTPDSGQTAYETSCRVFCEGPILEAIQMARLFPDSKTFVDMPLLVDPGTVESAFASTFPSYPTVQPTRQELMEFLGKFFAPAGSDMLPWVPDDWTATPAALVSVQNATVRGWLLGLNHLWLSLGRQLAKDVLDHPERHTLLWQPNPLMVPGGRFIETYYWDSLWVSTAVKLRAAIHGHAATRACSHPHTQPHPHTLSHALLPLCVNVADSCRLTPLRYGRHCHSHGGQYDASTEHVRLPSEWL